MMAKHADPDWRRRRWYLLILLVTAAVVSSITAVAVQAHARAGTSNSSAPAMRAAPAVIAAVADSESAAAAARAGASVEVSQVAASASAAAAASAALSAKVAAITNLAAGRSSSAISIAALNTSTGASYQWGATGGMDTGSIVKLYILETLLLQRQNSGGLTPSEQATATTMIENSNNDSAETLFEDIGGRTALSAANPTLGLTNTTPGPGDYWGLTQTCAADYIALLRNLVAPTGSPLTATSQAYVLALMRSVESDQRWGVGVTADAGTDFANKNGWLGVDDDGGLWLVNSTGVVTINGQQVLMVVLTQHDSDFDSGIALTESLAKALAPLVT
jgi:hypothetical protein